MQWVALSGGPVHCVLLQGPDIDDAAWAAWSAMLSPAMKKQLACGRLVWAWAVIAMYFVVHCIAM
jgi:hypothetical protein